MTSPHQDAADLVAELRAQLSGDHVRGCEGRQYGCDCGYDLRTEGLLELAANFIEQQAKALSEAEAHIKRLADAVNQMRASGCELKARLAEAMKVIEPFAAQAECWPELQDNQAIMTSNGEDLSSLDMLMSDLRAARSFLNSASNKDGAACAMIGAAPPVSRGE